MNIEPDYPLTPAYKIFESPDVSLYNYQIPKTNISMDTPESNHIELMDVKFQLSQQQQLIQYILEQLDVKKQEDKQAHKFRELDGQIQEINNTIVALSSQFMQYKCYIQQQFSQIHEDFVQLAQQQLTHAQELKKTRTQFFNKVSHLKTKTRILSKIIDGSKIHDLYILNKMRDKQHKQYIIQKNIDINKQLQYTKKLLRNNSSSIMSTKKSMSNAKDNSRSSDLSKDIEFQQQKIMKHLFGNNLDEKLISQMKIFMTKTSNHLETLERELISSKQEIQNSIQEVAHSHDNELIDVSEKVNTIQLNVNQQLANIQLELQTFQGQLGQQDQRLSLQLVDQGSKQDIKIGELTHKIESIKQQHELTYDHVTSDLKRVSEKMEEVVSQQNISSAAVSSFQQQQAEIRQIINQHYDLETMHYKEFVNFMQNQEQYDVSLKIDDLQHRFNTIQQSYANHLNKIDDYGQRYIALIQDFTDLKNLTQNKISELDNTLHMQQFDVKNLSTTVETINSSLITNTYSDLYETLKKNIDNALQIQEERISQTLKSLNQTQLDQTSYKTDHEEFKIFYQGAVKNLQETSQQCIDAVNQKTLKNQFKNVKQLINTNENNVKHQFEEIQLQIVQILKNVSDHDKLITQLSDKQTKLSNSQVKVLKNDQEKNNEIKMVVEQYDLFNVQLQNMKDKVSMLSSGLKEIQQLKQQFNDVIINVNDRDHIQKQVSKLSTTIKQQELQLDEHKQILVLNNDIIQSIKEKLHEHEKTVLEADSLTQQYKTVKGQLDQLQRHYGEMQVMLAQNLNTSKEKWAKELQEFVKQYNKVLKVQLDEQQMQLEKFGVQIQQMMEQQKMNNKVSTAFQNQQANLRELSDMLNQFPADTLQSKNENSSL